MAHIFKHPTNNAKGILVFTHKEFFYFQKGNKINKNDLFFFWKLLPKVIRIWEPFKIKKLINNFSFQNLKN